MDLCFVMNRYIDIGKDKYKYIYFYNLFYIQPQKYDKQKCFFLVSTKVLVEFLQSSVLFWNWKFFSGKICWEKKRQSTFFYKVVIHFDNKKSEGYKSWAVWCCFIEAL